MLHDYLVALSEEDLALPVIFFECLKSSQDPDLLDTIQNTTELAIDCIYACANPEMYLKAKAIFEAVVIRCSGRGAGLAEDDFEELERELECLQILNKYDVKIPLRHIKEIKDDSTAVKELLTQMSENFNKLCVLDTSFYPKRL